MIADEEELRKNICEECLVGKGGNGFVYKILGTEYVFKKINLHFNKIGQLNGKNEKKKYSRFRDEISVVLNNQKNISGILPIFQCSSLPEKISKDTFLYYVMPFATSLDKVCFTELTEKIQCFQSLFSSLAELHEHKIAHRDIKPQNIYQYNSKFVFADFGLVSYPNKQKISMDEKKIGPWATIAPEMERNPFGSNPFLADVYSLAKTLWIILTNNPKSFEGQYNYFDESISLNNNIEDSDGDCLGILHEILRQCTSNSPEKRPTAKDVADRLTIWLKHDIEQLSEVEWDLLLREIVTSRPKNIIWDDPKEIGRLLSIVGKTRDLNHTFFPTGGGLDLHGAKIYSNGKVELDFGYKIIVQPKLLRLNLYEDAMWNHFYLETSEIFLEKNGDGTPYSGDQRNDYLQIDENTYIERWKKNYPEYDGVQIPENAQEVTINHFGNYVIFPKISFYNLYLDKLRFRNDSEEFYFDPYSRLHEKLKTSEMFTSFIETIKKLETTDEKVSIPREWGIKYGRDITQRSPDSTVHERTEKICKCLEDYDFRSLLEDVSTLDTQNGSLEFQLNLWVGVMDLYFLNVDYKLVKRRTRFSLMDIEKNEQETAALFIKGFNIAVDKIKALEKSALDLIAGINENIEINFSIQSKRTAKIALNVLDKDYIRDILYKGNDDKGGILVLGEGGDLLLIELEQFSNELCPYSANLFEFDPHENILGNKSGNRLDSFIDDLYEEFLAITLRHLRTGQFVTSAGDTEFHTIEKLKELITLENEKYTGAKLN